MATLTEAQKRTGIETGREILRQIGWGNLPLEDQLCMMAAIVFEQRGTMMEIKERLTAAKVLAPG